MYKNQFVVAIKHDGKILREIGDIVKLPFGCEFTVLVKNLNSRRAKFRLHIDGADVLDGTEIIVNGNSEAEIKRFIRNGNMDAGNAFKFIERTVQIENGPRGIKADDGIVRVEYWFEQEVPEMKTTYHRDVWLSDHYKWQPPIRDNNIFRGYNTTAINGALSAEYTDRSFIAAQGATASILNQVSTSEKMASAQSVNDAGITVPGSKVEQKFSAVYGFIAEAQSQVIILRMVGKTANDVEVAKPVTVKTKNKCSTCGRLNKVTAKFCTDCGTALELL